jgi:hypothetical protein
MIVETVDIVRDLVENINLKLNIKTVRTLGDLHTITVCDTLYLSGKSSTSSNPYQITIDSNEYDIISVNGDTIVLQGSEPITKGLKSIASPYFFHGTVTQTNNELSAIGDVFNKTPMIYFRRTFTENWSRYTSVERTAEITLFFLTQANFDSWQINDYDTFAIKPMRNLCYKFIDSLLLNKQIGKIENYSIIDNIKFATFVTDKGYENQKFNDTLSGVQLDISLPIRKNYHCNC